ncbi:MAG: radical SAM/SPASM domain-containing protein [Rhodospirillales bacterium]|nr:radical SAM/SPASM domain-containing protein [Rhodospirillales bacterium]
MRRLPLTARQREAILTNVYEMRSLYEEGGMWFGFVSCLSPGHFAKDAPLSRSAREALFKASVRMVEIEPHSYCNRVCPFCPNAMFDRHSEKLALDLRQLEPILSSLAGIGYRQGVRFALYSEPLSDPQIVEKVALTRKWLPSATIDIVSNGDYLTASLLEALTVAGLNFLRLSIYTSDYTWSHTKAEAQVEKISRKIGIAPVLRTRTDDLLAWDLPHPRLRIDAHAKNLGQTGFDRGATLEGLIDPSFTRMDPCPFVFDHVTIYHDGVVMPCCNLRSDVPAHDSFAVGRLGGDDDVIDLYASPAFAGWRESLARVGDKTAPCATCKQNVLKTGLTRFFLARRVNSRVRGLGK